jgi:hypothetical protein
MRRLPLAFALLAVAALCALVTLGALAGLRAACHQQERLMLIFASLSGLATLGALAGLSLASSQYRHESGETTDAPGRYVTDDPGRDRARRYLTTPTGRPPGPRYSRPVQRRRKLMRRVVLAVAIALICGLSAVGAISVYSLVAPAHADGTSNGSAGSD